MTLFIAGFDTRYLSNGIFRRLALMALLHKRLMTMTSRQVLIVTEALPFLFCFRLIRNFQKPHLTILITNR